MIKNEIEEEMDNIKAPVSLYAFAENIVNESRKRNVKSTTVKVRKSRMKKYQYVAAAVLGLGILIGSAFLNPAMAEMASKIPYLGRVFEQKPVYEVIHEALEKEGYKELSVGARPGEVVSYEVIIKGTEEDVNRERGKITGIVEEILKGRGYDNFQIEVAALLPEIVPLTEEEKKMHELINTIEKELKTRGYDIITVNLYSSEIEVSIPTTEKRTEEIKEALLEIATANGTNKNVILNIEDREASEREGIWMDFLGAINAGLEGKSEYKYRSYGYSYKNNNLKINIKTTLTQNDPEAKVVVEKLRNEINAFLNSDTVKNSKVANDTYELHFLDSKNKELEF